MEDKFFLQFSEKEREAFRNFLESPGIVILYKYLSLRRALISTNSMDTKTEEKEWREMQGKFMAYGEMREFLNRAAAKSNNRPEGEK